MKNVAWYYWVIGFAVAGLFAWWYFTKEKTGDYRLANLEKARAARAEKLANTSNDETADNEGQDTEVTRPD